jgi:hypothetical protein
VNHKEKSSVAVYTSRISQSAAFAWVLVPARGSAPPVRTRLESTSLSRLSVVVETEGVERRIDIPFDHGPSSAQTKQ